MKIIIIHIGDILIYPPVMSLIHTLENKNIETIVITTESKYNLKQFHNVKFEVLSYNYEKTGAAEKLKKMLGIRRVIDRLLKQYYDSNSFIWITYNVSLKHINTNNLSKYHYVLQLMELMETIKLYEKAPLKLNAPKIAEHALAVVVPEYNRAHITKAWWNLSHLPLILPNKPYYTNAIEKGSYIEDETARNVIDCLSGKKIILYQGILTRERPIDKIIMAVDKLGEDYAFVVMSGGKNIYSDIPSCNYYFIPFVAPPLHLQVTSHAYIGVLTYLPVESEFSKLNVLYCAPNKTFEYGMFGVPMLGNDLPGLQFLFKTNHCGECFDEFNEDSICRAIKSIEDNYDEMSMHARKYYDNTDYAVALDSVLEKVEERLNEEHIINQR